MATIIEILNARKQFANERYSLLIKMTENTLPKAKKGSSKIEIEAGRQVFGDNRDRMNLIAEGCLNYAKNPHKKVPAAAGKKLSKAMQSTKVEAEKVEEQGITA